MRPASILWFERLLLTALAIDLVNNLWSWSTGALGRAAAHPAIALLSCLVPPALGLWLWYLVARKASNLARWIIALLVVLGSIGFVGVDIAGAPATRLTIVATVAELLKLAAILFLFAPDAKAWFARSKREA